MNPNTIETAVGSIGLALALSASSLRAAPPSPTADTPSDPAAPLELPVTQWIRLDADQLAAARQGRLGWRLLAPGLSTNDLLPIQWQTLDAPGQGRAVWLLPPGATGSEPMALGIAPAAFTPRVRAALDPATGQVDVTDHARPVLRYNYRAVEPGPILAQVAEGNRIYARARSDYLHPLHGPGGETLTRDWSLDHPHHRGIYWAWPEVEFGQERGDLHALQTVFARPTGRIEFESGPVFAQLDAENLWLWQDRQPVVRERTLIRAYRATAPGRVVDLEFHFLALEDGVTLARRGTEHYGGLNLRLARPESQQIQTHTDPPGSVPRRAWSDLSGIFAGSALSGLTVLQHAGNPEYPGDWIQ